MIEIELAEDPFYDAGFGYDSYEEFGPPYDLPPSRRVRRVAVKEARRLLTRDEANKLIDWDQVAEEGIQRAEQTAVVFIDEIDKIVGPKVEIGRRRLGQRRAARPTADRRGDDGDDALRAGQDRPHPVHRGGRVQPGPAVGPYPRAPGAFPAPGSSSGPCHRPTSSGSSSSPRTR